MAAQHRRLRPVLGLVAALLVSFASMGATPVPADAALPAWKGGINLYRTGVFSTQKTWLWCTAADVQIMRNIVFGTSDHTTASQQRYFDAMRAQNRYRIPESDGVDPAGWTAGLREYVDRRYRLVSSTSFDSALRSAVTNLRKTNLPVAITVSHGNHAWVLTGFTATADPAATTRFTVTSVRVTGPLWGLQSRSYGYDMKPDTKLTPRQLSAFFTPWHYTSVPMAWENRWVSVQPIPSTVKPAATPSAMPKPSPTVTLVPSSPAISASSSASALTALAAPAATAVPAGSSEAADPRAVRSATTDTAPWFLAAAATVLGLGLLVGRPLLRRRGRGGRT